MTQLLEGEIKISHLVELSKIVSGENLEKRRTV